ncbi:oxygen-independent coproporphyrinogen-3 oxidase [Poseidonocella pacifica]|uniref:Coproporphyrinogen-III oxidase n=2 Tax=Poseidonocella pacifica TaxID=871651 RepID=A0A1I0XIS3_9RHOB|nr:oxygen-independent coproporphyrinogen-3 oxidase [Poseidonocella pacifica]
MGLFDAKVPRYTSYPTAPQFTGNVNGGTHCDWIKAIPEGAEISLYVHIPFCRRLCWFCACRTQGTQTDAPVIAYLEVLKAELAHLAEILPAGVRLSRLHWGGGTPTLLSPVMIRDLARSIFAVAPLAGYGEFSVEIDPNEIDGFRIAALMAAGMTRASVGVQDFDPTIQAAIGRSQSYEVTRDAITLLRTAGVASLNADILYGLPHQTRARMTESVQRLLSLGPDRVALYGYAHVPWMAKRQQLIPTSALPTPEERLNLFETARRLFLWDGYAEIGIDHFAMKGDGLEIAQRTGRLRRNFQGYTDDAAEHLIGVGASAISRFPQGYTQNAAATAAHMAAIREGRFSTSRGHALSREDRLRAAMIEAVMCDFRIDMEKMKALGADPAWLRAEFKSVASRFPGVTLARDEGFEILPEGRPLTRMIAHGFDAYELARAGHSSAV